MAVYVRVDGKDIEIDYPMIDGALNLMALACGNNLDQETIRRSQELKRMVARKLKDECQSIKPRIGVTVSNKSRCEGSPKRKIIRLDHPAFTSGANPGPYSWLFGIQPPSPSSKELDRSASTARARPRPSSRAFGIQPSTSRVDPCSSSSMAVDQHASTSRARPGPSSRAFRPGPSSRASGIQPSTSRVEPCASSSMALDQNASISRTRPGPSSRAFGIQPSTPRAERCPSSSRTFSIQPSTSLVEPCLSSGAFDQPASTSRTRPGPSSTAFSIQPSTPRVEPSPSSSRALDQSASTSRGMAGPSLPGGIQDLIGLCSEPIQKQITASDVSHGLCRLMLPKKPMEELLRRIQLNPNENIKKGIAVTVYGPDGREYSMIFKMWVEKYYVLKSASWKQFCQDYGLRSLTNMPTLTIWMFRHRQTDDLCFAITW